MCFDFFFRFGVFNCLFKEAGKQTQVQHAPRSWELIVYFKVHVEVRGELFFMIKILQYSDFQEDQDTRRCFF